MNQYNHAIKKKTILKMTEIYIRVAYILAVSDLYLEYLMNYSANRTALKLIDTCKKIIYIDLHHRIDYHHCHNHYGNNNNFSFIINKMIKWNDYDIKETYHFLAYILEDFWIVFGSSVNTMLQRKNMSNTVHH